MFCPKIKKLRYLSDPFKSNHKKLFEEFEDKLFLGNVDLPEDQVIKIVEGDVDPDSLEEFKIEEFPED